MTTDTERRYTLTTPCRKCPFRSDVEPYIRPERAKEIADSLRSGANFTCHKTTVDPGDDEDGDSYRVDGPRARECAGALITMEKEGFSNQNVRIAERLGLYDPTRMNMDAPVYGSLAEWVKSYQDPVPTVTTPEGEVLEFEHCGVVAQDCEDPAGFAMGGGVVSNDDPPTCNPLEGCSYCGSPMCSACRASEDGEDGPQCVYCAEDNEDDEDGD